MTRQHGDALPSFTRSFVFSYESNNCVSNEIVSFPLYTAPKTRAIFQMGHSDPNIDKGFGYLTLETGLKVDCLLLCFLSFVCLFVCWFVATHLLHYSVRSVSRS